MKKEHKKKIRELLEKQLNDTRLIYLLAIIVCGVAIGLLIWFGVRAMSSSVVRFEQDFTEEGGEVEEEEKSRCEFERHIDGVCVDGEEEVSPRIVGIMIENHVDSRPQAGLADARVVYEAPVEANYSRFFALYTSDQEVEKIGPVRSSRHYYLDWLREYRDVLYMHVGGSPLALHRIRTSQILSINEMGKGWYFWRSKDRYAPHNTYTSSKLWGEAYDDYWKENFHNSFDPWKFSDNAGCEESCVEQVRISFLPPSYEAVWKYNAEERYFERYQDGRKHKDQEDGDEIIANTLIIQKVKTIVLDEIGRLDMETIGSGKAVFFINGNETEGIWEKKDQWGRTKWFDEVGDEMELNAGKIWIEVLNDRASYEVTKEKIEE
ncbi:MAG: DUF3048 domain-containing protein [Candidatus Magasanikbacteria bacterium]